MSADLLRRAASLMRERVEVIREADPTDDWYTTFNVGPLGKFVGEPDAAHIASWRPAVALAVADWLDSVAASLMPPHHTPHPDCGRSINDADEAHAHAVARAYLGADS